MLKVVSRITDVFKFGLVFFGLFEVLLTVWNFSLQSFLPSQACDTSVSRRAEKLDS